MQCTDTFSLDPVKKKKKKKKKEIFGMMHIRVPDWSKSSIVKGYAVILIRESSGVRFGLDPPSTEEMCVCTATRKQYRASGPVVRVLGTKLGCDAPCYSVGPVVRVLGTKLGGDAPCYSVVLVPWFVSLEQLGGDAPYDSVGLVVCVLGAEWVVMHLATL